MALLNGKCNWGRGEKKILDGDADFGLKMRDWRWIKEWNIAFVLFLGLWSADEKGYKL